MEVRRGALLHTREEWLDQLPTSSVLVRLPAILDEVLAGIGAAIDSVVGNATIR
jgi:hypothetical protein